MDLNQGLDDIFNFTNAARNKEDNIKNLADSPLPDLNPYNDSASSSTLAFALSSSAKKIGLGDGGESQDECPKGTKAMKDAQGKTQCVGVGENVVQVNTDDYAIDFGNDSLDVALTKTLNLINLFVDKVDIIGFNENQQNQIIKQLMWMMMSKACADAFRDSQIPTLAQVAKDHGIAIIHRDALDSSAVKNLGLSKEQANDSYVDSGRNMLNNGGGLTLRRDYTDYYKLPSITILHDRSFSGGSFGFDESFIHESIHRSGVGIKRTWFQYFIGEHDLSNYEHYEKIIKNCTMPAEVK